MLRTIVCVLNERGLNMSGLSEIDVSKFEYTGSASALVYEAIKGAVLTGALKSNEFITETSVAEHFNVSRTPVRDALNRLKEDGFLDSVPRKGLRVKSVRSHEVTNLYVISLALETCAARLAAENRTRAQIDSLAEVCAQFHIMQSEPMEISRLNCRFHVLIAEASGNPYLYDYVRSVREKLLVYDTFRSGNSGRHIASPESLSPDSSHEQIMSAIVRQDGDIAELLMRRHIVRAQAQFDLASDER